MTSSSTSKPNWKFIAGIVFGTIVGFLLVQQLFFSTEEPINYDAVLEKSAEGVNRNCPMMVDDETQLVNAEALPGKVFQYNYKLIRMKKEGVNIDEIKRILEPNIMRVVARNPELKNFRDNGVTMAYQYKDMDGEYLFEIKVTPEQYANK